MLEASRSFALRTCMGHLQGRLGRLGCFSNLMAQSGYALVRAFEGVADASGCGAADYIVAIDGCLKGDACKKISIEFHAKLFQFRQRKITQFAALVEAVTDGIAYLFVGFAKWYTFV